MKIEPQHLARWKDHPLVVSAFSGFCCSAWMAGTAQNLAESGELKTAGQVLLLFLASILASVPVSLHLSARNKFSTTNSIRVALVLSALFGSGALLLVHSRGVLSKAAGVADWNWPPIVSQVAAFLVIALLAAGFAATFVPAVRRRMERNESTPASTQD
jgi:hypothetical protein